MKRILSILLTLCLCSMAVFADEQGDEYDDGYVYQQNGAGDRFLKIELDGLFPLNFGDSLKPGFGVNLGYYKFFSDKFAVGGEVMVTNSFSIGNKALFMIPLTGGIIFQPSAGKFEFPLLLNVGLATETWASMSYWPALTFKASAGVYYRFSESWSFGASTSFMSITELFAKNQKQQTGMFVTGALNARYHFQGKAPRKIL